MVPVLVLAGEHRIDRVPDLEFPYDPLAWQVGLIERFGDEAVQAIADIQLPSCRRG